MNAPHKLSQELSHGNFRKSGEEIKPGVKALGVVALESGEAGDRPAPFLYY
jgi:hypothetical protein